MTVMTADPPLALLPGEGSQIGAAAGLVEDCDGSGRVFVHGNLWLAWDAGDEVTRRLAAVQLVTTGVASAVAVAEAFGVNRETLRRWQSSLTEAGAVGLCRDRPGPRGPSKITAKMAAEVRRRRDEGGSLQAVADAVGISVTSVRRVLADQGEGEGDQAAASEDDHACGEPATEFDEDHAGADIDDPAEDDDDDGGERGGRNAATGEESEGVAPVLADPPARNAERGLARYGLLDHARPVFTPAGRVPLAGLLLALPGLEATGLLTCARHTYQSLPAGFYGLDTVLTEAVFRTLAGEPRAEGATRIDPVALGRVLGLDRAPEVKTIRRKLAQLAAAGKADELLDGLARHHLDQASQQASAVLYVDGHVRAYHGTRKIAKTHSARLRFPAPATVETWVSDAAGDPVLVVMAEPAASLAGELRRLLPQLREAVADDRRVLVGFDRGGWSPVLFKHMHEVGFDVLTWRKGPADDIPDQSFSKHTYTDEDGRVHQWEAADTRVDLLLDDNTGETFAMRQITRRDHPGGRQAHILTTREDLSVGEVIYRMGSRWRQENHFRYARMHFDLDSHDTYQHHADDPDRQVPNPAKKTTRNTLAAAKGRRDRESAHADEALLALRTPTAAGGTVRISNADHNQATAGYHQAEAALAAAEQQNQQTPARLPLGEVNPGQQVLDTETKLLTHAIKIAAYNTATALARDIRFQTDYPRADDEAHTLARQLLTHTGDLVPDYQAGTLTVRLDPLPTRRATRAAAELCDHLTATQTHYPSTDLVLRYEIKNRR